VGWGGECENTMIYTIEKVDYMQNLRSDLWGRKKPDQRTSSLFIAVTRHLPKIFRSKKAHRTFFFLGPIILLSTTTNSG
jgi:hypothetical protein